MAKRKSIFSTEQTKTVSLSTKVSEDLKNRIDQINERLALLSGDKKLRFNVSSIMAEAIEEAVDEAESELEVLEKNTRAKKSGSGSQSKGASVSGQPEFTPETKEDMAVMS